MIDAGGLVGRHVGDGVVAFFLAETTGSESAAARACISAARALRGALGEVATRSGLEPDDIVLRFGLHWGSTLYVGAVTTSGRAEVTALGDEVNEAARIEACATGGLTLASKALVERLEPDDAAVLDLDPDRVTYTPLADLSTATEKARRDAPAVLLLRQDPERDALRVRRVARRVGGDQRRAIAARPQAALADPHRHLDAVCSRRPAHREASARREASRLGAAVADRPLDREGHPRRLRQVEAKRLALHAQPAQPRRPHVTGGRGRSRGRARRDAGRVNSTVMFANAESSRACTTAKPGSSDSISVFAPPPTMDSGGSTDPGPDSCENSNGSSSSGAVSGTSRPALSRWMPALRRSVPGAAV